MTEEIIIDGVDVSGCNCFIEKMNFPNNLEGGYYNQKNLCECGVQGVESYPFFCKDNPNCNYKNWQRAEQKLANTDEAVKFRQIIKQIKKIAEGMNTECFYDDFDCKDCDMKNGCTYQEKTNILQKISECEAKVEYNTKDIRHINENNQEYIAECNRMTK